MEDAAVIKELQFEINELESNHHSLTELNGQIGSGPHRMPAGLMMICKEGRITDVKKAPARIIGQKGSDSIVKSHEGMIDVECSRVINA